ncbi:MAG: hypothetical protein ACRD7E_09150, partial [Bryobacteraceae bacterium]
MRSLPLALMTLLAGTGSVFAWGEKDGERLERKMNELSGRAERFERRAASEEAFGFFTAETGALFARARAARPGSHQLDRLLEAIDDFLDAGEALLKASRGRVENDGDHQDEDDKADTARRLERAYFRVQQGEYF